MTYQALAFNKGSDFKQNKTDKIDTHLLISVLHTVMAGSKGPGRLMKYIRDLGRKFKNSWVSRMAERKFIKQEKKDKNITKQDLFSECSGRKFQSE